MSVKMRTGAALVGLMAMASPGNGWAASGFDGTWSATVNCPTEGDVEGYVWQFPVSVQGGHLSGKYVNPNDPGNYGVLSGSIGAGGDATLSMSGKTGVPAYSVKHVAKHSPIRYTASAHFDATSGSGKRVEQRSCDLTFAKG